MVNYADAVNDALDRLDDLGYERSMGGGDLANHGPMGAEALAVLGHGDQVPAWIELYRNAVPHYDPPTPWLGLDGGDESSWRPALGDIRRAGDWEQLFQRELDDRPWQDVLARWWPRLLPGPMTGLTHGLIRTAHAVRGLAAVSEPSRAQLSELCRGLGYWASRFIGTPGPQRLHGTRRVTDAIAAFPRVPRAAESFEEGMARLRAPAEFPGYDEAVASLADADPQWLISEMTAEFAGTCIAHTDRWMPVPLIHGVTAPAAARLVLPHLPAELHAPTVAALWRAQVTLLLLGTTGSAGEDTARAEAQRAEVPAWHELIARAVDHGDEHVIKFTEACSREHALRPDPRYGRAAEMAQRRIARPTPSGS